MGLLGAHVSIAGGLYKAVYRGEKLLLSGDLNIHSGLWEREVDEGVQFYTDSELSAAGSTLLNMLEYDLKIASSENIKARTSLGEVEGIL